MTVQPTVSGLSPSVECDPLPGWTGEHALQCAHGTQERAHRFYPEQVADEHPQKFRKATFRSSRYRKVAFLNSRVGASPA
jgi:hypothetical protein